MNPKWLEQRAHLLNYCGGGVYRSNLEREVVELRKCKLKIDLSSHHLLNY